MHSAGVSITKRRIGLSPQKMGTGPNHRPREYGKEGSGPGYLCSSQAAAWGLAGVSVEETMRRLALGDLFHQAEAGSQSEGEGAGNESVVEMVGIDRMGPCIISVHQKGPLRSRGKNAEHW